MKLSLLAFLDFRRARPFSSRSPLTPLAKSGQLARGDLNRLRPAAPACPAAGPTARRLCTCGNLHRPASAPVRPNGASSETPLERPSSTGAPCQYGRCFRLLAAFSQCHKSWEKPACRVRITNILFFVWPCTSVRGGNSKSSPAQPGRWPAASGPSGKGSVSFLLYTDSSTCASFCSSLRFFLGV